MEFLKIAAIVCLCLSAKVQSYTYNQLLDTSSGYCEISEELKIPVGEDVYDNEKCERITCSEGMMSADGCGVIGFDSSDSKCRLVRGSGTYPDCCEQLVCS